MTREEILAGLQNLVGMNVDEALHHLDWSDVCLTMRVVEIAGVPVEPLDEIVEYTFDVKVEQGNITTIVELYDAL